MSPVFARSGLALFSALLAAAAHATPAYDFAPVEAILQEMTSDLDLRGSGIKIYVRGQPAFEQFLGTHSPDTIVPIASASKTLSAAVIMALVDEGRLSLDDRVAQYVPGFNKPGGYADITIRQCFSHTSGLPGDEEDPVLSDDTITLAEAADIIAQRELIGPPGGQFAYGGLSMQVAGRCAEVAAGQSWDDLFLEKIARPLGLTQVDYTTIALLPPYRRNSNPRIAGGVRCSLRDYATFFRMLHRRGLHEGGRVLSEAAVREMQRDHTAGLPIVDSPRPGGSHYGIGMWIEGFDLAGTPTLTMAGGAFGFAGWLDPAHDICGAYQVVDRFPNVEPYLFRIFTALQTMVDTTPPSAADLATRLVNLSTRGPAGNADATLIAGFATTGDPRDVIIRGIGPALAEYDVPQPLADPILELFSAAVSRGGNDDWSGDDGRGFGAFVLDAGSRDAVLTTTLPAGLYTAQVSAAPDVAAGEALAEVYLGGGGADGRLVNLSTRGALAAGQRLIAGLVVSGAPDAEKRILVRAVGPSLTAYDVTAPLANPQLEIYNADGVLLAVNDDWGGTSALDAAFVATGAFPLADDASRDAAIVVTLAPGAYTAHVRAVESLDAGVTLVEFYELP